MTTLSLLRPSTRGDDLHGAVLIAPGELGQSVALMLDDGRRLDIVIPPQMQCGMRLRLRGLVAGGRGDLYLEVHVGDFLAPP